SSDLAGGAPALHRDQFDLAALHQPRTIGRIALPEQHFTGEQLASDGHGGAPFCWVPGIRTQRRPAMGRPYPEAARAWCAGSCGASCNSLRVTPLVQPTPSCSGYSPPPPPTAPSPGWATPYLSTGWLSRRYGSPTVASQRRRISSANSSRP